MDKEDLQRKWDEQLIGCWRHHIVFNQLLHRFFLSIDEIDLYDFCENVSELEYALNSFGLRRTKQHKAGGLPMKSPVRAYVATCSPHLNNCLLSGVATDDEIINAIEGFEWRTVKQKSRKARGQCNADVYIRKRLLSGKNQWDKVS